jgi:hypothetical protein
MTRVADAYQLPLKPENVFLFLKPKAEEAKKDTKQEK